MTYEENQPHFPEDGIDAHFTDEALLRQLYGQNFVLANVIQKAHFHLKFRKTFVPRSILTDKALKFLQSGVMYVHGKTKDHRPIIVFNAGPLRELIPSKQIDPTIFLTVHHYIASYLIQNSTIKGQNERWIIIVNVN